MSNPQAPRPKTAPLSYVSTLHQLLCHGLRFLVLMLPALLLGIAWPAFGAEHRVDNSAELDTALRTAGAGDVIYLDTAATYTLDSYAYKVPSITIISDVSGITVTGTGSIGSNGDTDTLTVEFNLSGSWTVDLTDGDGTLALVSSGEGNLNFSGGLGLSGGITVSDGYFRIVSNDPLYTDSAITVDAGELTIVGSRSLSAGAISGAGTIQLSSGTLTTTFSGSSTVSGRIASSTTPGTLVKAGPGTLTLSHTQNSLGAWKTRLEGGTVSIGSGNHIGSGAITFDGSNTTLAITGGTSLSNDFVLNSDAILADGGAVTLSGDISGPGGLTKSGSQTVTLSGTNTYTGNTTVNAGTLVVSGSSASSTVSVANGAMLSGSGTVGGISVPGNGIVAPGNGPGTLTVAGNVVLSNTSNLNFQLDGDDETNDVLAITGNLTLDGVMNITDLGNFGPGSYTLMTYTGSLTNQILTLPAAPEGLNLVLALSPGQVALQVSTVTYNLSYAAGANGSLTGTTAQTIGHGSSGTAVTAVANTGYHFTQWSDGSTANPRTDANITANMSVTANFAINEYALTYAAGANGALTGTTSQTVNHGSGGTAVTAVADTGYHFVQWSDGSTANPRTDTNVTAALSVTAQFASDTFALTYSAGANGTLTGTTSQTVAYGNDGTSVTAVPDAGYEFSQWSDGSTDNPRTDTNISAALNVTAEFTLLPPPEDEPDEPLQGTIRNPGTLTDPNLGSGAHVIGGKVGGNIVGTGPLPARIDAEILPGSTLCNVVIGANAVLRLPVTLCPSVRFAKGARVPLEMDLSGQFDPRPWGDNGAIIVVDLSLALYEDGTSLLDSMTELPALNGFLLTQNEDDRTLRAQTEDMLVTLLPVSVTQAGAAVVPGLSYNGNGHLVITNATGQQIVFLPMLSGSGEMEAALQAISLQLTYDASGTLVAVDAEGRPRYVARAGVVATPAADGSSPGLNQRASHLVANTGLLELVFADADGTLWRQALWPIPLHWQDIVAAVLEGDQGDRAVSLGPDGLLAITLSAGTQRGYFDYRVEPGTPNANPGTAFAFLNEPEDRNGDGIVDWLVVYPDGSTQVLYVLP